jgi:prepilin-type N-terminal cleavage/methylation domain-containing protein
MEGSLQRLRARREELGDAGGFTLIELLIVIVVLGILAGIVVFAVQNLTGQSATAACQAQYKTAEVAQEAYRAQIGSYAPTFAALEGTALGVDGSTDGPWLKDAPPDATTSGPYYLFIDTANGDIQVATIAANGAKSDMPLTDGIGNCVYA